MLHLYSGAFPVLPAAWTNYSEKALTALIGRFEAPTRPIRGMKAMVS